MRWSLPIGRIFQVDESRWRSTELNLSYHRKLFKMNLWTNRLQFQLAVWLWSEDYYNHRTTITAITLIRIRGGASGPELAMSNCHSIKIRNLRKQARPTRFTVKLEQRGQVQLSGLSPWFLKWNKSLMALFHRQSCIFYHQASLQAYQDKWWETHQTWRKQTSVLQHCNGDFWKSGRDMA